MIPVLVCAGLIGIIGGKTTIRYYNLTISENFFNLDHDRIQNDIIVISTAVDFLQSR